MPTYSHAHPFMHQHSMNDHPKKSVFWWYPPLVILYAIFNLGLGVAVTIPKYGDILAGAAVDITMAWLVFNLILLIVFIAKHYEAIALVLPIYYLVDYVFSMGIGMILKVVYGLNSLAGQTWFIGFTAVFAMFEIGFALYLIFRNVGKTE